MTAKRWAYGLIAAALGIPALFAPPAAHADQTAYLINVQVRPGYNFPNAYAALGYGHGRCDKVAAGQPFTQVMGDVRTDFHTDDCQAS